jgi:isopenicillin-N epimerase
MRLMLPGDEPSVNRDAFLIEEGTVHLNHGSFGSATRAVLRHQAELRERMERNNMRFFTRELVPLLDEARAGAAAFVGADERGFAFVPNATFAVNSVLRSIDLAPGDELLTTNHTYNACTNVLVHAAEAAGARVVVAEVPFPLQSEDEIISAVLAGVSSRTKLALLDHVTSRTALVFPIARLVAALRERGVPTLVDGAHAPGQLDLDVRAVGAAYYTGNFHKWVSAPKGAAFLAVGEDQRAHLRPAAVSHGANFRSARSRFQLEFDWTGTSDPTAWLTVPTAIAQLDTLWPGGLPALRARNRALALRARDALASALGTAVPAPASMIGWMASVLLPDHPDVAELSDPTRPDNVLTQSPLQVRLAEQHHIESIIFRRSASLPALLRVSVHAYTTWADFEALLAALKTEANSS